MTTLLSRLFRPSRRADHLNFTVYTRAQCCCCHKAIDLLKDAQQRHGFTIDEVDIDTDPELVAKYNTEVPVVRQRQSSVPGRGEPEPAGTALDRRGQVEWPG